MIGTTKANLMHQLLDKAINKINESSQKVAKEFNNGALIKVANITIEHGDRFGVIVKSKVSFTLPIYES